MIQKNIVEIKNLSFGYGNRMLHKDINMVFPRGKVTAIMGGSGCGKTTILRLIGGQIKPKAGQVTVDGKIVHKQDRQGIYELRRKMGMLFQHGALFTDLSVFDNVAFPMREHTKLPLARAIALDPDIIMYDEPFAGLDPISMAVICDLIRTLNDALGATSIIVTHDVEEAFSFADYIYFVADGTVAAEGTPKELSKSKLPFVHQFVHGEKDGPVPFHYNAPSYKKDIYESV